MKKLKIISPFNIFICILLLLSIIRIVTIKDNYVYSNNVSGTVTKVLDSGIYVSDTYVITDNKFELGSKVKCEGEKKLPDINKNFYLFNYRNYLKSIGIFYTMKGNCSVIGKTPIHYKIKNTIIKRIDKYKSKNYLYAFIIGDSKYLNKDLISYLGISHLFSISGMHVACFIMLFEIIRKRIKIPYLILFFFLLFYIFITSYSPSVIRAVGCFYLFKYVKINKILLYIMFTSVLLIINPYYIYHTGFLYSFIISFFLIRFSSNIDNSNIIKSSLYLSLYALVISFPIQINQNFYINLLAPIYNLIFIPLITMIIFPLSLLTFIIKPLDNILYFLLNNMEYLITIYNKVPSIIIFPHMNIYFVFIYYIVLYILSYKRKIIYILVLIIFQYFSIYLDPNYYVLVLDVGQGDSSLLITPFSKKTMLIDTGGNRNKDLYEQVLKNTLYSRGIKKIDYMIITHGDFDHMGEAINLVNNFKVENVILNSYGINELENDLIEYLESKKINYYIGLKELNIGKDNIYFLNTKEYDNENDNSNVLYLKINDYNFLFMGDAGIEREEDILKQYKLDKIHFIKIGHHGSSTSSSKSFINRIKPKTCLISVGMNNRYGHPKAEVLDILSDYCDIYRTDINGSIEIKIHKNNYEIKTYST